MIHIIGEKNEFNVVFKLNLQFNLFCSSEMFDYMKSN